jgi:hypothetical protein
VVSERFEAETPLAASAGVDLAGALGVALGLIAGLLASPDPRWTLVLVAAAAGSWLAARWLLIGVRYELSRSGLAVRRGPFESSYEWASLASVGEGSDPLSGCRGLVLRFRGGEHVCVRPRDREAFVAALLRYVCDLELAPGTVPLQPIEAAA